MSALPGYTTLLDIAKANGSDVEVGLIDETTRLVPEVRYGHSRTIRGTSFKTWVRTGLPGTPFRQGNQGVAVTKSAYENREVSTFILNPQWECDKAIADRYEFGAQEYIANEAEAITEGAMQGLGRQFFYGRNFYTGLFSTGGVFGQIPNSTVGLNSNYGGDVNGFPGLIDGFNTTYELDAGGTTANTASSVWMVKYGNKNVTWVYGNEGQLNVTDVWMTRATDSASNPFTIYRQELLAYPGLMIGDQRGVTRIKNVTADSGKGLTDKLLYDAMALTPGGVMPDVIFMNRRTLAQLRDSRTATNITGAPAPIPADVNGVPIYATDSLAQNEPINWLGL